MTDYFKRILLALSFTVIIMLLILVTNNLYDTRVPTVVLHSEEKL